MTTTIELPKLSLIEAELQRRRWVNDPVAWARERLGDFLWSSQIKILESVRDNRRTCVQSCHEIGKSFTASLVVGWWIDTSPPGDAFVVTSAPSGPQVKTILWREISRVHTRGNLPGRVNQVEWIMRMPDKNGLPGKEEQVAIGRKPDEYEPTAFQGIHAMRVLYVFDEACGMPPSLWEAGDSLIANDFSKALAIGNPDDPQTEFARNCAPGSGWNVVAISAFDTPAFTGEVVPARLLPLLIGRTYVEEKRKKWAPSWRWTEDKSKVVPPAEEEQYRTNPLWQSKVLGRFPLVADSGGLIPMQWVRDAQLRVGQHDGLVELGVDVGAGGDSSCITLRKGYVCRVIREDHNPDTMQTAGNVVAALRQHGASSAKVDVIGIGKGVVDRGVELKLPFVGISVGEKADDPKAYVNRRAELYWFLRELFEQGLIDIEEGDDDLAGQLMELRYKRTSAGQIQIESKDEMKRRKIPSPNRAESLMLAVAPERLIPENVLEGRAVW